MNQRGYLVLMVAFLSACNPLEEEGTDGAITSTAQQDVASIPTSPSVPDTSSWIRLLDKTTGITHKAGQPICVRLTKSYRKKGNAEEGVIVTNLKDDKYEYMSYRYTVTKRTSSLIKAQLGFLHQVGFLDVDTVVHETQSALQYRLTNKGWGESSITRNYMQSLCYETGKWKNSKILDYELLDDQKSGLEVYKVKFEIEYKLKEWASSELLQTFKHRRIIPKASETFLVKGPRGYLNTNPARNRGMYQNTIMPTSEEGTRIAKASDKFITILCKSINSQHNCIDKEKPIIKQSLLVHNVGIPSRGNMTVFKFSFNGSSGVGQYRRGSFKYVDDKGWEVE